MAKIVFVEINDRNTIVGIHNETIPTGLLPQGYSIVQKETDNPESLLGLDAGKIDDPPASRPLLNQLTPAELLRNELRQLSIELDLMARLTEDTTAKQAEFDAKKTQYQAL